MRGKEITVSCILKALILREGAKSCSNVLCKYYSVKSNNAHSKYDWTALGKVQKVKILLRILPGRNY